MKKIFVNEPIALLSVTQTRDEGSRSTPGLRRGKLYARKEAGSRVFTTGLRRSIVASTKQKAGARALLHSLPAVRSVSDMSHETFFCGLLDNRPMDLEFLSSGMNPM